ncbi:MAG: DNA methyltransferase [Pseudomonadota bacterium]
MSAIHDLIAQVSDPRLRERLAAEWASASKEKKFGLVFEDHLPERLPLPKARPRRGDLVCRRAGPLKDVWRVLRVRDGVATCVRPGAEPHATQTNPSATETVDMAVDELLVVREFGEPIFPSLVPMDAVQNGDPAGPWHTLIEADNYHALQLLDYLYAGQVDCIYIDPPYNTGARDWKYNNDYVDANDQWRHSKWLAFMERRLKLAKRLLKPDSGVLVVTIDQNELHHLGMLLESLFPEARRQLVTICITPSGTSGEGLSRVEEYAVFCFLGQAQPVPVPDDMLLSQEREPSQPVVWESLLRRGAVWYRIQRPNLCYPVVLDPTGTRIVDVGEPLPFHRDAARDAKEEASRPLRDALGRPLAWPVRTDGKLGIWRVDSKKLRWLAERGYAYVSSRDEARGTWTVRYLMEGTVAAIDAGDIAVQGRGARGEALLVRASAKRTIAKTMWVRGRHTAGGAWGTTLITETLKRRNAFSFPKSLYSTKDAIEVAIGDRKQALILDFFAGSGTTLHAVNLLNAADGGRRRCILVTNNEVSAEEAEAMRARGLQPGDDEWEAQGICRSVTWPRSKYTILGRRDDGSILDGEYFTGKTVERDKPRRFRHLGFIDPAALTTAAKKQLVALIDGLPQTLVTEPCPYIVSEDHTVSVLFDPAAADEWLDALDGQAHISDFVIVAPTKRQFDQLKAQVNELLGPLKVTEEEKRPMREGFAANLAYFKLDFLDPERVSLRRAFREILPLLWLKAGAVGPRPELRRNEPEPALFAPEGSNFVVLLDETRMGRLLQAISGRTGLSHVFIVTDADESFKTMAQEVQEAAGKANPSLQVVQLYRDYLLNFMINLGGAK